MYKYYETTFNNNKVTAKKKTRGGEPRERLKQMTSL
jgi:hypothetical protein